MIKIKFRNKIYSNNIWVEYKSSQILRIYLDKRKMIPCKYNDHLFLKAPIKEDKLFLTLCYKRILLNLKISINIR
jgi:hypothetical protein